jgi:toluene monooxygenase system ferredoxin subunit
MAYEAVTTLEELREGDMLGVRVSGRPVLVVRLADRVCAYENRCAHLGVPLDRGRLEGYVLTCAVHHYEYDARTGRGINPRAVRLPAFAVDVARGVIHVDVSRAPEAPEDPTHD